jgi:hypothetical protein
MASPTIEERVAILEKDVAALKQFTPTNQPKPGWIDKIAGSFKDDADFGEILRLGQEIRKADRLPESDENF